MTPAQDALDTDIDTVAEALALPIGPAWKANLQVTLRLAAVVAAFELPDDAEPASTFEA